MIALISLQNDFAALTVWTPEGQWWRFPRRCFTPRMHGFRKKYNT
jgi:hypothetical protein